MNFHLTSLASCGKVHIFVYNSNKSKHYIYEESWKVLDRIQVKEKSFPVSSHCEFWFCVRREMF
jgi:hypothetical protein